LNLKVQIPKLFKDDYTFPNPEEALDEGLLAWGGDLSELRLMSAYENGIFPWFSKGDPLLWWSPNPRAILYPKDLKISKSLSRNIKKFEIRTNENFEKVIFTCKSIREDTWISEGMQKAYIKLHERGIAKSVECYFEGELVGGLYGVKVGSIFCGESMFSLKTDASKVALWYLCQKMIEFQADFIDCQMPTSHLLSLGAVKIPRTQFLKKLKICKNKKVDFI
jgi:leucyl/phenylalanyl-tRNA--protein transferase